ncbi:hypothetical protein [Ovoidimarina sediminis]|uniref:hypothetical protein n=1 Tax=Ovoidimarina sediminis TaxID=3079856 RepID=UPI00290A7670|nr:hypothetical protein [Rhodophyticola sp. MJ-SS7]MDU8942866.1 hypothetical protein [Rhodophyticola sp. MJ-SS7]
MTPILQAAAAAVLALGSGAAAMSVMNRDVPDLAVPAMGWAPGDALDGQSFLTLSTVRESGETLENTLHFADGRFQSEMCQRYCDFGWSEYRTATEGKVVHFTATTRCPDAPHTVVWYGTVRGDRMEVLGTWTTRRWYWTRQINVTGTGDPVPIATPAAEG